MSHFAASWRVCGCARRLHLGRRSVWREGAPQRSGECAQLWPPVACGQNQHSQTHGGQNPLQRQASCARTPPAIGLAQVRARGAPERAACSPTNQKPTLRARLAPLAPAAANLLVCVRCAGVLQRPPDGAQYTCCGTGRPVSQPASRCFAGLRATASQPASSPLPLARLGRYSARATSRSGRPRAPLRARRDTMIWARERAASECVCAPSQFETPLNN